MKFKDLLGISLVSIFLFPVVLIGIMLAAGVVHLEAGDGKDKERLKPVFTGEDLARQQEAEAKQLKAYQALQLKERELQERESEVNLATERLENLKLETLRAKEEIASERKRIEEAVGKSAEAQDKRIASLAEVYGGMRPDEAAPILLSLDDAMVVRIMKKIPEARSASKLMASIAALDVRRAAAITRLMGGKAIPERGTPAAKKPDGPAKVPEIPGKKASEKPSADAGKTAGTPDNRQARADGTEPGDGTAARAGGK